LPDGRSTFGAVVAGFPDRLHAVWTNLQAYMTAKAGIIEDMNWSYVFQTASNGVWLYEASANFKPGFGESILLRPDALAALYETAAISADKCGYTNLCLQWIDKAFTFAPDHLEIAVLRVTFKTRYGPLEQAKKALKDAREKYGEAPVASVRKNLGHTGFFSE
jgi:hypothetical protein